MNPPLVTIGVTTFNAAASVRRALESAVAQDHPAIEIVVVDDASSDDTVRIVREFAAFSPRPPLRLFTLTLNEGVSAARNRIVAEAAGEFIAFFDDDDTSAPDRISRQLARLLDYEATFAKGAPVICHTAREQIYPDGARRIEATMGDAVGKPAPAGMAVVRRVLTGAPLPNGYGSCATCSQLARTVTYRHLGGFDTTFRRGEDTDLAVRLAAAGGHFVGIGEPLVTQLMTGTSDKSLADEQLAGLRLVDKHRRMFGSDAEYRFCRNWIKLKFALLGGKYLVASSRLVVLALRNPLQTLGRARLASRNLAGNRMLARFLRGATHA